MKSSRPGPVAICSFCSGLRARDDRERLAMAMATRPRAITQFEAFEALYMHTKDK